MAYNIGLNVVEVDGSASPAIVGAAVSVAAFNIITRRGVPNRPARVTSFAKFVEQFGGFFAGGYGAYLVKGFFDNGGQTAYINRVVASDPASGAAPATARLKDGANKDTLELRAGYRSADDPGTWGDDLHVKVTAAAGTTTRLREIAPAKVQSSALVEPIDLSALPSLSVQVDGETAATVIAFQAADFDNASEATLVEIRDAINRHTTKLSATISADKRLVLTSNASVATIKKGWTSLKVGARPELGFADAMESATFGTPAARSSSATSLASVEGLKVGDAVRVSDGNASATTKILSLNAQTGEVGFGPEIAALAVWDPLRVTFQVVEFDLEVFHGGTRDEHRVERWPGLSMEPDIANYALARLNDPTTGSRFLVAVDAASSSGVGADAPAAGTARLGGGRDGAPTVADFNGDPAAHTGFFAFDPYDVQLVASERSDPKIVVAALAYCAQRGDCMFVGSVPESQDVEAMIAYGQAFQGKKVFGALYGPWVVVPDPIGVGDGPLKKIPPTGHVMGVYARVEANRGVWKAPAGDEASLLGVLDVERRVSEVEHTAMVREGSVNGIRVVPRAGIIVDASRTLSTDTRWLYVNVRLLFNYVKSSLKQGLRWVRQEPNRSSLWSAIKYSTVTPFLMGLWRQGAFGSGTPQQVFTVICDASNNPPDQVDQGNLKIEVYFYPSRPAETIVIVVGQQPSGALAAEV